MCYDILISSWGCCWNDPIKKNLHEFLKNVITVDSRYLEVEGTHWNTSRYAYFDISDVQTWGKYQTNNQISQMNM